MIITGMIIAISVIGAYIFLGMKLSESIIHDDIRIFFWALYFVTLLTLVNVSISIYFYSSLKNKKGPLGTRGVKGKMGERGDSGSCNSDDCKSKTVQIMIEEKIQERYLENDITPLERKKICNIVNNSLNKTNIKTWTMDNLKTFKNSLETNLKTLPNMSLINRIKEQDNNNLSLDNLQTQIISTTTPHLKEGDDTQEC
jgi:predicted permease